MPKSSILFSQFFLFIIEILHFPQKTRQAKTAKIIQSEANGDNPIDMQYQ